MELLIIFCAAMVAGVVAAMAWKLLSPNADGFTIVMVGLFVVLLGLLGGAFRSAIMEEDRAEKAKRLARQYCAPGKARVFQDTAKKAVIFSCASDGQMKVIGYSQEPKMPKRTAER